MNSLHSAEKMVSKPVDGQFIPVKLYRESEANVIFISCDDLPELFVAVTDEHDIRGALDTSLKGAFSKDGRRVQVYTNGSIHGPIIDAMVHLTSVE